MNIKDVAELAGVSVASISRAFQDPPSPYISQKQRERILKICEELHYCPDIHSQRMNSKRSNTIAFLSRHTAEAEDFGAGGQRTFDYNFGSVIMGAQIALAEYGKSLQLIMVDDDYLAERRHLKMVRSRMVDGVMIWGAIESDSYVTELLREKVPVMLLTTDFGTGVNGGNSVVADEYAGMAMLVEAVLQAGHRRIAVLEPGRLGSAGAARMRAILDTFGKFGVVPAWISPENGFNYNFGSRMTAELLKSGIPVSCVIASNDTAAWGCIAELQRARLRVPDDISVVGADGIPVPGGLVVDSFYLPAYEIGMTGARTLCRCLDGEIIPVRQILPVTRVHGNTIRTL